MEELTSQFEKMMKQFSGFQTMMQSSLDSLNALGAWQATADKAFGDLHQRVEGTTSSLEAVTKRVDLTASWMDSLEVRLGQGFRGSTGHPTSTRFEASRPQPCSRFVLVLTCERWGAAQGARR